MDINSIVKELEFGKGWVCLKDNPSGIKEKDFLSLMHLFGTPLNLDEKGSKVLKVEDEGVSSEQVRSQIVRESGVKRKFRPYMTNIEIEFHTDLCDLIFLSCICPAESGGTSKLVCSFDVFNHMKENHPKEFDTINNTKYMVHHPTPLEDGNDNHLIELPIFSFKNGFFASHLLKTYIELTNDRFDLKLTDPQLSALSILENVAEKLSEEINLKKGDTLIINNHLAYHARTSFVDGVNKRSLYRGWVSSNFSRPLNDRFRGLFGDRLNPGMVRGGY